MTHAATQHEIEKFVATAVLVSVNDADTQIYAIHLIERINKLVQALEKISDSDGLNKVWRTADNALADYRGTKEGE